MGCWDVVLNEESKKKRELNPFYRGRGGSRQRYKGGREILRSSRRGPIKLKNENSEQTGDRQPSSFSRASPQKKENRPEAGSCKCPTTNPAYENLVSEECSQAGGVSISLKVSNQDVQP